MALHESQAFGHYGLLWVKRGDGRWVRLVDALELPYASSVLLGDLSGLRSHQPVELTNCVRCEGLEVLTEWAVVKVSTEVVQLLLVALLRVSVMRSSSAIFLIAKLAASSSLKSPVSPVVS